MGTTLDALHLMLADCWPEVDLPGDAWRSPYFQYYTHIPHVPHQLLVLACSARAPNRGETKTVVSEKGTCTNGKTQKRWLYRL